MSSPKAHKPERNGVATQGNVPSVWKRAATANSKWDDKEEFLDVIYWGRQALGIIVGIIWGLVPLKGFIALMLFALVNAGLVYLYFSSFQCVEEEEYGGAWELTKEGFMTSFAGFLVLSSLAAGRVLWASAFQTWLDDDVFTSKALAHSTRPAASDDRTYQVTWIIIYSGLHFD